MVPALMKLVSLVSHLIGMCVCVFECEHMLSYVL